MNELENRVQDLERQNALLRALYERHKHLDTFLSDETLPPIGRTGSAVLYELWEFIKQAAIDGGAVDNETADSFRQAWSEVQAGDVRPIDELWDGIDGGALEEGE